MRAIDSGETQTLAVREVTDINRVRWFPDGNKLLISGKETGERGRLGIWSAGTHRKCAQEAAGRGFRGGGIDRWKADAAFVDPEGKQLSGHGRKWGGCARRRSRQTDGFVAPPQLECRRYRLRPIAPDF